VDVAFAQARAGDADELRSLPQGASVGEPV
jgi:hypothetical protein